MVKAVLVVLCCCLIAVVLGSVSWEPEVETRYGFAQEGSNIERWSRNPFQHDAAEEEVQRRAAPSCSSSSCPGIPIDIPQAQVTKILQVHNNFRDSVNPAPATKIPHLVWNSKLAQIWKSNPAQCNFRHTTPEMRSGKYASTAGKPGYPTTYVGENLSKWLEYTKCGSNAISSCKKVFTYNIDKLLQGWGQEKGCYSYATTGNGCDMNCARAANSDGCGHYTQQIWSGSTNIGCLILNCTQYDITSSSYGFQLVCDYYQGGNINGQYPYAAKHKRDEIQDIAAGLTQ